MSSRRSSSVARLGISAWCSLPIHGHTGESSYIISEAREASEEGWWSPLSSRSSISIYHN
uniref:Uncharacterized protein n=1 Tax=Arundo donax TaxID=35708 RepID=A0A0A9D7P3_ARUDO